LELVVEGAHEVGLRAVVGQSRNRLLNTAVLLKGLLMSGALQDQSGPSLAVEGGLLAPELGGDRRVGATLAGIISDRGAFGSAHFNQEIAYARTAEFELVSSLIVEGPATWTVRPVAELGVEWTRSGGAASSALLGAIWSANEALSLDLAFRISRTSSETSAQALLGFTWSTALWRGPRSQV
jgi:hypothetical protein